MILKNHIKKDHPQTHKFKTFAIDMEFIQK